MHRIFSIDNPVMQFIVKIFDCICLSVLWVLFSLPVITAGASTTALYTTVYHYIRNEEGRLWQTFWGAFRENWKRSTLVWLVVMAVSALLAVDVLVFRTMRVNGELLGGLYWLILVLCCVAITWVAYLIAYAARFQGRARDVLRISLILMLVHPFKTLIVFILLAIGILLVMMVPGLLAIMPAGICVVESMVLESVFASHLQPKDNDEQPA